MAGGTADRNSELSAAATGRRRRGSLGSSGANHAWQRRHGRCSGPRHVLFASWRPRRTSVRHRHRSPLRVRRSVRGRRRSERGARQRPRDSRRGRRRPRLRRGHRRLRAVRGARRRPRPLGGGARVLHPRGDAPRAPPADRLPHQRSRAAGILRPHHQRRRRLPSEGDVDHSGRRRRRPCGRLRLREAERQLYPRRRGLGERRLRRGEHLLDADDSPVRFPVRRSVGAGGLGGQLSARQHVRHHPVFLLEGRRRIEPQRRQHPRFVRRPRTGGECSSWRRSADRLP